MHRLAPAALALALAVTPVAAQTFPAQAVTGIDWQLLAIDGTLITSRATLRIDADGTVSGMAPCNRWSTANTAVLPDLAFMGIRATRMACDDLAGEQAFFDALTRMTSLDLDGDSTLILTGPDGQSMEFLREVPTSATPCKTCLPQD